MASSTFSEKYELLMSIMRERKFSANKLPTEEVLTELLDCSRGTLREILKDLEVKGYVSKKHSVGNFLHPSAFATRMRIDLITDFNDLIADGGYTPSVKLITGADDRADIQSFTRERLGLSLDAQLEYTERVYYADDRPAIFCRNYVPRDIIIMERRAPTGDSTLFEYLKKYCSQEIEQAQVMFRIMQADAYKAKLMEVAEGAPLLLLEEAFYNYYDEVVSVSYNHFNLDVVQLSMLKRYNSMEVTPAPSTRKVK